MTYTKPIKDCQRSRSVEESSGDQHQVEHEIGDTNLTAGAPNISGCNAAGWMIAGAAGQLHREGWITP